MSDRREASGREVRERAAYASPGSRVTILEAAYIDDVEVGRRVAGHIRVAFEVGDAAEATSRLAEAGATVIAYPVPAPWNRCLVP